MAEGWREVAEQFERSERDARQRARVSERPPGRALPTGGSCGEVAPAAPDQQESTLSLPGLPHLSWLKLAMMQPKP